MITIEVNGTEYDVPSSASDTNWAAAQVAFEQAVVEYVDAVDTVADTATTNLAALSTAVKPTGVAGTAGSGTGISASSTNYGRHVVHKITVAHQAVAGAAVGAASSVIAWSLPAKTRVLRILGAVTAAFTGGTLATVTMKAGITDSGNEFLLAGDVLSGTIVIGDGQTELGARVLGGTGFSGDVFWAGTDVYLNFASTGDDLTAVTTGSVTLYIEACTYP